jgi:exopolysaccharide biosynthesis polyprenyl glycosylphosphotransferase
MRILFLDGLTLSLAWTAYYWFRIKSGWVYYVMEPDFWIPMIAIGIFWLIVFFFFGLYKSWYAKSRLDEIAAVFKSTTFGSLILFFLIFIDDRGVGSPLHTRLLILVYWSLLFLFVGGGRVLYRTFQRRLREAGIGLHNTLIVGLSDKAWDLYDMVRNHPALGYRVLGFVSTNPTATDLTFRDVPVLGTIATIPDLVDAHDVKDVLIALDSREHDRLLHVIAGCDARPVSMKIVPDLYDIISGQARTNQIYGFPLIEIMPELMPPWERAVKRTIDIAFSLLVLVAGLPVWMLIALLIKLDSKGPVFYAQDRVGKDGSQFKMIKFRSMLHDAEKHSGPVWANKQDPRVTRTGKILRRLRLDEIPQFINVLDGDMSLVGPRPERQYFVEQFTKEIPLYSRRLKVRPGITGWAQVKHKYDETIDDVRKKVEYDLFYIENMSLRMDFKILLNTISVVLLGKGH